MIYYYRPDAGADKSFCICRTRDLAQSCERDDNNELRNCQCNDAQRRVDLGQLDCGYSEKCPDDCEVCKFCLYYVVDCYSHSPSDSPSSRPSKEFSLEPSLSPSEIPSTLPTLISSLQPTGAPSQLPTLEPFNITDCGSYSNQW